MRLRKMIAALMCGYIGFACLFARGEDYQVTASGPLVLIQSEAKAFDGTSTMPLPDILDVDRLQGGSFRATYRFTPVTPQFGTDAIYELSPTSGMISYELLDASGAVVHRGTNPSEPLAFVENNSGSPPFSVDQVLLASHVNDVTGWHVPSAIYSVTPDFSTDASFNFFAYVDNSTNYLNDLSIPTDAATYLYFPSPGHSFGVLIEFGDGDYGNQTSPYQHVYADVEYTIASLNVTAVPEPCAATLLGLGGMMLLRRRLRRP